MTAVRSNPNPNPKLLSSPCGAERFYAWCRHDTHSYTLLLLILYNISSCIIISHTHFFLLLFFSCLLTVIASVSPWHQEGETPLPEETKMLSPETSSKQGA